MMTRFVLAALLTSFSGALTTAAEIAPPKQQEILEWFRATGVRWAVYTEYIVAVDSSQSASLSLWASKRNELNKPGFAKLHVSYLAGAIKDADRFQATWSEGIREVLKVPVLSREEADRILGYMIERREAAKGFSTDVSAIWRTEFPVAEKSKAR